MAMKRYKFSVGRWVLCGGAVLGCLLFASWAGCAEVRYRVSGTVSRNGKGVPGIPIDVYPAPWSTSPPAGSEGVRASSKTDALGRFAFSLPPGEYGVRCWLELSTNAEELSALTAQGPHSFRVTDASIENLDFTLDTDIGIVEANADILNSVPPGTPAVSYKCGRIPLHSEKECRQYAQDELADAKAFIRSDIVSGATLGTPIVFVDFHDNPVFYQYPVVSHGVEVSALGVHALGTSPQGTSLVSYREVASMSELEKIRARGEGLKMTWDSRVPDAIAKVAEAKHCEPSEVELTKLICTDFYNVSVLDALLRIVPRDESVLVDLYTNEIRTDDIPLDNLRFDSELKSCLAYVLQVKQEERKEVQEAGEGTARSSDEDFLLADQFRPAAVGEGADVRGADLMAPLFSGRPSEPVSLNALPRVPAHGHPGKAEAAHGDAAQVLLTQRLADCGGEKPCLRSPCDPKRPCCRAFSLDVPRGARLRSGWAASLTIGPDGIVTDGEVRTGCGNKSLDNQLLEKIKESSCFERTETGMILEFSITFD